MSSLPPTQDDWSPARPQQVSRGLERRARPDRRQRLLWAFFWSSIRPRRRRVARLADDGRFQPTDWHGAHLWAVSLSILILSLVDAFLTVTLMSGGAVEINPVMAAAMGQDIGVFAILKTAMTGVCVMLMVFLARYRFMRVVRVEMLLYGVLVTYVFLMSHELGMLRMLPDRGLS